MKHIRLCYIILLCVGFPTFGGSSQHAYGLLTPDYGVITEDDLAYDACQREVTPYNPNEPLGSLHWQCFDKNEVTAGYDSWRGNDGMGEWNKIYTMCTLEIRVRHGGELQLYVDRRAHRIGYCRDFVRAWRWITKNQTIVCLNGDGGGFNQDEKDGKYKLWTWEKFKTKNGCYSYFAGECNTKGYAAKKKCPE